MSRPFYKQTFKTGYQLTKEPNSDKEKVPGTLRFLGCCRCSRLCFLCSSLCRRPLYSSWFSSSVWCCSRMSSIRSFCSICSCLRSMSWVDSSCRIIRACSISFWVLFLFSSWDKKLDVMPFLMTRYTKHNILVILFLYVSAVLHVVAYESEALDWFHWLILVSLNIHC